MKFYRNSDLTNFIATDDIKCAIITKTQFVNSFVVYFLPFKKMEDMVYEESTHEEFFSHFDTLTAFATDIFEKKTKNGQGLKALLSDAETNK